MSSSSTKTISCTAGNIWISNLINARMWLPFVLSQIFLRRRCCSCNTDVSITLCGVQESAYYQDLPCLAKLSESVPSGTEDQNLVCHLVSPQHISQKNGNPGSAQAETPAKQGSCWRWLEDEIPSHSPPPNPKLKSPYFSPPPKNSGFKPQRLKTPV